MDQKTPLLCEGLAEDSLRIPRGFASLMEDSRTKRIFLCGFLKESNETTVPFYNIKRGEVGFHGPSVADSRILEGLVLDS